MSAESGLVLVAAGSSARMEGTDKVWASLGGQPVVWWSLRRLAAAVDAVVVVVHQERLEHARSFVRGAFPDATVVQGGTARQESVRLGLDALPQVKWVAVHDAARPFASADLLSEGFALLSTLDGAVPAEPVRDTIKRVDEEGLITETLDRTVLRACQTPQVFRGDALRRAHRSAVAAGRTATDDAALLESTGARVGTFAGRWVNYKITMPLDLELARLLIERGEVSGQ